jgi:hypothetical protein
MNRFNPGFEILLAQLFFQLSESFFPHFNHSYAPSK